MKILVTGSEGFIGRALVDRLAGADPFQDGRTPTAIVLLDHAVAGRPDPRIRIVDGDLSQPATFARAIEGGVDVVFHLASLPGGAAERDFETGLEVNLKAVIQLLETLRQAGERPRFVLASTIGIFGVPMPACIDEETIPEPSLSYGAHKYISEILVSDYSRRGYLDGVSLRLPGIVARPPTQGMLSIFLSDLIRQLSAGQRFVCPVAADAPSWWMSRPTIVDNLIHAALLDQEILARRRTYFAPILRLTIEEVVDSISAACGIDARKLVSYAPDAALQAQFASYPPLHCPQALAAGFRSDGDGVSLVTRALQ